MANIYDCIFHNKLGSDSEVQNSVIGANGTIFGTLSYAAAKFDNGYNNSAKASGNYIQFANALPTTQKYVVEFWWKPNFASTSAADADLFLLYDVGTVDVCWCVWWGSTKKFFMSLRDTANKRLNYYFTPTAFSSGDLIHILVEIDYTAAATQRIKMYQNGASISYSSITTDQVLTMTGTPTLHMDFNGGGYGAANSVEDNFRMYNSITYTSNILLERNTEVIQQSTFYIPIIEETLITNNRSLTVANIDLLARRKLKEFPDIEYIRGFEDSRLFINELKLKCKNGDGFFNADNPASPFYDLKPSKNPVKLYDGEGFLMFDGYMVGRPTRNEEMYEAEIKAVAVWHTDRYNKVVYTSAAPENGAGAVENILTQYGLQDYIDTKSFNISKSILDSAGVTLTVGVAASDDKNLLELLELIGKYSCADVYDYKGKIHFQVWQEYSNRIISKVIDGDGIGIVKKPEIDGITGEKLLVNDYSIQHSAGTADDSSLGNIGALSRTFNGTHSLQDVESKDIIELQNETSARWVGEQWIKRTNYNYTTKPRPRQKLTFEKNIEELGYFDLTTLFRFDYQAEAWTDKYWECHGLKYKDSTRSVEITAWEFPRIGV